MTWLPVGLASGVLALAISRAAASANATKNASLWVMPSRILELFTLLVANAAIRPPTRRHKPLTPSSPVRVAPS